MNIVLGATGTNGREVVRALLGLGERARAVVRDPAKAVGVAGDRVEVVAGELTQIESLERAFAGGSRLFLLVPVSPTQADMELDALRAARAAGIGPIVKLSAIGADPLSGGHFSRAHGIAEAALRQSGLGWTIVRGAFFYSNLLFAADAIKGTGQYTGHWGGHPAAWVDPTDLAEVCAQCMVDPGQAGATLTATGPAALTNAEVCEALSRVLGRRITYVDQPPKVYEQWLRAGAGRYRWRLSGQWR